MSTALPGSPARLQSLVDAFRRDVERHLPANGEGVAFASGELNGVAAGRLRDKREGFGRGDDNDCMRRALCRSTTQSQTEAP